MASQITPKQVVIFTSGERNIKPLLYTNPFYHVQAIVTNNKTLQHEVKVIQVSAIDALKPDILLFIDYHPNVAFKGTILTIEEGDGSESQPHHTIADAFHAGAKKTHITVMKDGAPLVLSPATYFDEKPDLTRHACKQYERSTLPALVHTLVMLGRGDRHIRLPVLMPPWH